MFFQSSLNLHTMKVIGAYWHCHAGTDLLVLLKGYKCPTEYGCVLLTLLQQFGEEGGQGSVVFFYSQDLQQESTLNHQVSVVCVNFPTPSFLHGPAPAVSRRAPLTYKDRAAYQ